jgi:hypothetical protein
LDKQISNGLIWHDLTNDEIKQRVNSGELAANFAIDSNKVFNDVICLNCKGWNDKLDIFKQRLKAVSDNKCEYVLKLKYNGVMGVSNETITNAKAKKLIKDHPKGLYLFDKIPTKKAE